MRLEIRLAIVTLVAGVAAAVLAGRRATEEPVEDNEYLADFYRETKKYSFAMQVYLLNRRFQQHQEIIWRARPAIQDRTIYEDSIFCKTLAESGLMDERDYRTYVELFRHMSNFMCKPNVIVYLAVSPERSVERIQNRGRKVEKGITLEYMKALYTAYEEFIEAGTEPWEPNITALNNPERLKYIGALQKFLAEKAVRELCEERGLKARIVLPSTPRNFRFTINKSAHLLVQ